MRKIDIFYILLVCIFVLPLSSLVFTACTTTPAEHREQTITHLNQRIITISPRAGVECYVLEGLGSGTPRVMSCVALPVGVQ